MSRGPENDVDGQKDTQPRWIDRSEQNGAVAKMFDDTRQPEAPEHSKPGSDKGNPAAEKNPTAEKKTEDSRPLTPEQTEKEAKKLEKLANQFLSGNDENGTFHAWHEEMIKLAAHGMDSVKAVFEKMKSDTSGINPLLNKVNVIQNENGSLQININPSLPDSIFLLNTRNIGTIIGPNDIFSSADGGRIKHQHVTAFTDMTEPRRHPQDEYLDFGHSPYPKG